MIRSPQLPLLPGYSFNYNVGQTKFHKSQHFVRIDNEVPYLSEKLLPGIGGTPLPNTVIEEFPSIYAKGGAIDIPAWLAYDKQVLCFDAFYLESLAESGMYCNYIVRNCKILYFLEDGTIQVVEKPVKNSGLPQGVIIKRQKIRIPSGGNTGDFYGIIDLNVGKEIELYGKLFKITQCDTFTRKFLYRLGIPVPEGSTNPEDPYLEKRIMAAQKRKGKVLKNKTVKSLMKIDNRILTFEGYWDDQQTEGGFIHHLKILYFLNDDTIEIKDVTDPEKPYLIVKRTKIAKDEQMGIPQPGENEKVSLLNILGPSVENSRFVVDPLGLGLDEKEYYTEKDITIGSIVCLYGRRFVITNMDKFTKEYYTQKYGLDDLNPLEIPKNKEEEIIQIKEKEPEMAPYNGFGSYEDSAINCLYLDPLSYVKTWKRNIVKEPYGYDSKILRFLAELVSDTPQPWNDREFIISYYLEDDTISVYEIQKANSGIIGGYIIKRRKIYKPGQSKFSNKPPEVVNFADFFMGNKINLDNFIFYLKDIDEYSMKYMELHPNEFPKNNVRLIIDKLREGVKDKYKQWAAQFFEGADLKPVPYYKFRNAIITVMENKISEHEIMALGRHYKLLVSPEKISLENIRCFIHDELKRVMYDDFTRLKENFLHFDKDKCGLVSYNDAYIVLRGSKITLKPDFIKLFIEMFGRSQNNVDNRVSYEQIIDFLNYKKNPTSSTERLGFNPIYEFEKLATTSIDTRVSYIDIKSLLDTLQLEEGLKKGV